MIPTSPDLRQLPPRLAGATPRAVLVALALCAVAFGLLLHGGTRETPVQPEFLAAALGAHAPDAPLVREPVDGVRTRLDERSFAFKRAGASVRLVPSDGGGEWTRHGSGAVRGTPFGSETVLFRGEDGLEQFLTIERRQGARTWSWRIDAGTLDPSLRDDGSVEFLRGESSAALRIAPVAILDARGSDVTPDGLRWSLAERDGSWWLELRLDDSELPLPYVIDPAITQTGAASANTTASPLALTRPGNVGDLLVAHVAVRSTGAITAPAGWTLLSARSQTNVQQAVYWKIATGTESTSFSWAGGGHGAGGILAYANPHPTSPIDVSTVNSSSTTTATATGGTAAVPAEMIVALYSTVDQTAMTQTASQGVAQAYVDGTASQQPATRVQVLAADGVQAGAGAVASKTATANGNWVAHLVSIRQAPDDGSGTLTAGTASVDASSTGNTITFTYTAGPQGMANGAVAIDVPAGWSAPSTTGSAAGYTTATTGTPSFSGQRIQFTGVTLAPGATMTVTYGSKASGGPGATASGAGGSVAWNALSRGTATGSLSALASSPSINQVTLNNPPTATVSLAPASPTTNQTLTATATKNDADGDTVTLTYVWKVDGATVKTTSGSASLTDTLDLSQAGNGDKGQVVSVEVTPNDGTDNGSVAVDSESVANSAPTISAVSIVQAAPKTNDTLTVSVTSADTDGDGRTYTYQWKKNGVALAGETGSTLDLSAAGNGEKADGISVEVVASDGTASSAPSTSAAVTIQNSAPTVTSVSIDQAAPKTNDTLTITVATNDADGDAVTVAHQWKKNAVDRFGETAATFDLSQLGNGDKGDAITVEVTADDGTATSAPSLSAAVTVANSAPVLSAAAIDQAAPTTNDTLTATITATDADGDAITPTRQWRKNAADLTGETGASLDLSTAGNGDKGDAIALRVSVSDGTDSAGPLTSSAVTVANSAPTITSVSIDQVSPQTNDTLTVSVASADADGDAVGYAYQWRRNGVDIAGETGASLDLSLAGNGAKGDGITVRVTGSDGTASSAPSTSAARTIANTAPSATVTLSPASPTTGQTLTATATSSDDDSDAVTLTYVWKVDGATVKTTSGTASLTDTLDLSVGGNGDEGETVSVEVTPNDGAADGVLTTDSELVANSAPSATVSLAPASPTTAQTLTATATKTDADGDAVTLTYVWKVDGATVKTTSGSASLTDTLDLSQAGNGDRGEVVSVEVTPNDGTVDGATVSGSETVANAAPAMTTAAIDQAAPKTDETLTVSVASSDADGDARTYAYQWKKDGVDIAGATSSTLDLSTAGNGQKGDAITVEVTANDGAASSSPLLSAAVTIQNSDPVATVSLAPDPAGTNDVLTATATKTDADGDTVTLDFVWKVNGVAQKTTTDSASLTDTFDLSQPGNGSGGDTISVEVTPNDGVADGATVSDSVGVGNALPTATVSLSPASPTTGQTLTATATKGDTDGDTVTLNFVWKVDGVTVKTTTDSAGLTDTLDLSLAGNGDKGETVSVEVTPNDGVADGNVATDSEVVANTAPTATVSLSPGAPKTNDVVTATATKSDADGDAVTLTYVWKVEGATVKTTSGSASLTDTLDLGVHADKGETVTVEVTPNDGTADGTAAADSDTVANSAPVLSAVSIDQAAPKTADTLTLSVTATDADGDALTQTRQWRKNTIALAGATGATLDLSSAGNGDKGDALDVQLSVSDGSASSSTLTATAVTVVNSAPTVVSATIDQAAPTTNDTLTVTVVTSDADGDATTETLQWAKNTVDRFGETATSYDLSVFENGQKGDAITVRVVADDGTDSSAAVTSAAVTVANSAPVVDTVSIDQAGPKTNDTLTLSVTSHDDDGDAVAYAYQWRKNAADLGGAAASTLDLSGAGNGDEGDALAVRVTGSDGSDSSTPVISGAVTVANTAPSATVSLSPASPTTGQTLTATATKADVDGDTVTLTYVWKVDGAAVKTTAGSASLTDTLDLSQAGNGDEGEVVSVEVTPDDGDESGSTATDAETVANAAPTISSVTIDQSLPTTATVLSVSVASADVDGDGRTYTYQWRKNGVDLDGETGATLDLGVTGNGDKGDGISVRVVASDESASSASATSAAVTVQNTAPTLSSVTIDQAAPKTGDVLSVSVSSADADGDAPTYGYQWKKNGSDIAGATNATLDLAQVGNGDKGDGITVEVTADDGSAGSAPLLSAAVTVANTTPTITGAAVDQPSAFTNDTLTSTVTTSDADGDAVTVTRQWTKNGVDLSGETGASLDLSAAGNGDRGDVLRVEVEATDGTGSAAPVSSAPLTVSNSLPTATVALSPAGPATDDVVTATAATADLDSDTVALDYVWKVDGATVKTTSGSTSLTDTLDLSQAGNGDGGETVSVEVSPHDGWGSGSTASDAVVVDFVPAQLAFTSATGDLTSGAQRTLSVEIRDADGALVADDDATQVSFAKTAGTGTVTGLGTATAVDGVVTLDVTGELAGALTITATATGLASDASSFTVVHGAAAAIDLTLSGSDASGATKTLTATIEDAAGNTVGADSSTVVTFAQTGGSGTVGGLGTDTAAAGVASLDVTNALAGQVDLEASAAALTPGTASYTVVPGLASTATTTVGASPSSIVADGASTSTITVQLKDAAGNDLAASGGTVALSLGGSGTLGAVTDNGDGTYTATLTSPTAVGGGTVTGTLDGSALADSAAVTYTHGPATALVLTESGSTTAGDAHTLTATLVDANGNTVTSDSSTVVAFAKSGGAGTADGFGTATAAAGVASKVVTNRLAGQIDVEATAIGLADGATSWTIAVGAVSDADSTVTTDRASVINNGTDSATITVTLRDAGGNPISGKTVSLDDGAASSTITGGGATNASGAVTFTVTNTNIESATYTATNTSDALVLGDTAVVNFVFDDDTPPTNTITLASATRAYLSGTTLWYNGAAGGSFTLSSAVADGGAGPDSATYPPLFGYAGATVDTPAGGPYESGAIAWSAGTTGTIPYTVTARDAWTPSNELETTLNVTEDSTAPASSALCDGAACAAVPYTTSPVSVTLSGADGAGSGVASIRYTTDGSEPTILDAAYTGPIFVAGEGSTTIRYRAYDRVGNEEAVQTLVVEIDTTPPATSLDSTPAAATQDTTPTFSFSADESSTFEYRLDGGTWTPAASPLTLGPLAESTYTFELRATDAAGNVDATPESFVFTVDTTPADTTFTSAPPAATNDTTPTFAFSATDAGPSFEYRLDGGAWTPTTSPLTLGPLAEGTYEVEVRAKDAAGNADATPASHTLVVDTTAPETTILTAPADPYGDDVATFSFGADEASATFRCRIDGGAWAPCSSEFDTPSLADGPHTFEVEATDLAGNVDATPDSHTWTTDDTAPTGSLTAPAHGAAVSGDVVVSSSSADGGSGVLHARFEYRLAATSDPWTTIAAADTSAPYAVTWDTRLVADEDYELRVTTVDAAGNSTASATREVVVDNTVPTVSLAAPTFVNVDDADPAALTAAASDAGTGVSSVMFEQCSETSAACVSDTWTPVGVLDTVAPYAAGWPIPSDGTRLLRATATDGAGRTATDAVLVTVDRTRPTGSVASPADGSALRGTAVALTANASDATSGVDVVTFQISPAGAGTWADVEVGGDDTAPYTATLDTTGHADGLYDVRVFTLDEAGNAETTPATIEVRIDNTAPSTVDDAPAAWQDGDVVVSLATNDAGGSGVTLTQYRLDGGATQTYSAPVTVTGEGVHTLEYRSQDAAGNWEAWQSTDVRIDLTDPVTTDDAPAAWRPGAVTVTLSPADAGGSGLATTSYELDGGATQTGTSVSIPAAHGVHTITYRSTDAAGNVEAERTATVRIDLVAPTTTDDAPAALTNMPVTVTLAPSDADSGVAATTYEVNGGATQTGTSVAIPAVTGTYAITYRSTDGVGNAEATRTATVQVDASAPTTTATVAPANPHNGPITVSLSAADAGGAGVDDTFFRIDGGSWSAGTSAVVTGADGPHTVEYYSVDTLGNVEVVGSVTVTIDTTGPSGTPADPGSYLRGTAAELKWTPDAPADVSAVTFEFSVAGADSWTALPGGTITTPMLSEYTYSWNTTLVADGPYDLRVVVEDELGNETEILLPGLPKTVDNGAPTASVSTPAAGSFVSGNVALGGSANDARSGITATTLQIKAAGAAGFTSVGTSASGIVGTTWDSTTVTDGTVELKVVATDGAGNQGESAIVTFTVDNDAPNVTLADPGAAVSGAVSLSATGDGDVASVEFQRSPAGANAWTTISTDATPGDGFTASWATGSLADGLYELRARATDGGGNTGTSALRTILVDNALPTGSLTSPPSAATVGGPAVGLAATASDAGSGVASVRFDVKQFGSASFVAIATDTSAPFTATWDATGAPDGGTELRVVITDAAGNERTSAVVPVLVDSTGPSVTLVTPAAGAVVRGTVALTTTTGGGAAEVRFGVTPAGEGAWTELGADATAPFSHSLDTTTLADGVYDLRAVGFDAFGNASAPAVVANVRVDNTAPSLVSAAPADGSVAASASQIVLTASEPVTAVGAQVDGAAAPAPTIAGNTLTFATGALADGLHVLEGRLEDASGIQVPFRVAVTIESTPPADRPPVEMSASATGTTTLVAAGSLATVSLPAAAWPARPSADDFLVLRVDPAPAGAVAVAPGTQLVEVTARWALAGTAVTQFAQPLDVLLPHSAGFSIPAVSDDGTSFRLLSRLAGTTLAPDQADGYYVDAAGVHVVTRHLTWFALVPDDAPPTPPTHLAGVVAADGLTIRWIPGKDATGQIGNVVMYVNGESYREFGPTQYEAKLGPIEPGDTRSFHLVQRDAAGNTSGASATLRVVPTIAGLSLEAASAALAERGFAVGEVREEVVTTVAPGTVVGPTGVTLAAASSAIDLVVARGAAAPQTQFVMRVANAKRLKLARRTTVAARVQVTRPAKLTATLYSPAKKRLYTWRRNVRAGSTIVRLRLPVQVRRPGTYRVVWVARSGAETIRSTVPFRLVAPRLEQLTPQREEVEVVLAGEKPLKGALAPELKGTGTRVVADADSDETFALAAALSRNVKVVVVDVDRYGVGFVRDLTAVFPEVKLIALARQQGVRAQSIRAGAVLALPRSTPPAKLAQAIARVGGP